MCTFLSYLEYLCHKNYKEDVKLGINNGWMILILEITLEKYLFEFCPLPTLK